VVAYGDGGALAIWQACMRRAAEQERRREAPPR
jgi:hypothetical protein